MRILLSLPSQSKAVHLCRSNNVILASLPLSRDFEKFLSGEKITRQQRIPVVSFDNFSFPTEWNKSKASFAMSSGAPNSMKRDLLIWEPSYVGIDRVVQSYFAVVWRIIISTKTFVRISCWSSIENRRNGANVIQNLNSVLEKTFQGKSRSMSHTYSTISLILMCSSACTWICCDWTPSRFASWAFCFISLNFGSISFDWLFASKKNFNTGYKNSFHVTTVVFMAAASDDQLVGQYGSRVSPEQSQKLTSYISPGLQSISNKLILVIGKWFDNNCRTFHILQYSHCSCSILFPSNILFQHSCLKITS